MHRVKTRVGFWDPGRQGKTRQGGGRRSEKVARDEKGKLPAAPPPSLCTAPGSLKAACHSCMPTGESCRHQGSDPWERKCCVCTAPVCLPLCALTCVHTASSSCSSVVVASHSVGDNDHILRLTRQHLPRVSSAVDGARTVD